MSILKNIKDAIQGKAPLGKKRSSKWPSVRKAFLKDHPNCAVCGGAEKIELHHILPYHVAPEKELSSDNFIPLCESKKGGITCHLFVGHVSSYRGWNPNVAEDAAAWNLKLRENKKRIQQHEEEKKNGNS